eukprot:3080166-Heterocapsa_arctica.AAC.1
MLLDVSKGASVGGSLPNCKSAWVGSLSRFSASMVDRKPSRRSILDWMPPTNADGAEASCGST